MTTKQMDIPAISGNDPFSRVSEIRDYLTNYWSTRDQQMITDRSLINLDEPTKREGFVQVTLNEPRVQFDTSVAVLSSFTPKLRIPWLRQEGEDQDKLSKAERFINGAWREVDNNNVGAGRHMMIYELAYWACMGWVCWFPFIEKVNDQLRISCEFYDPITVYPQWGKYGLDILLRRYWIPKTQALSMARHNGWDVKFPSGRKVQPAGPHGLSPGVPRDSIELLSLWERGKSKVSHSVWMDGQLAKPKREEKFPEIPVGVLMVGGSPEGALRKDDATWITKKGANILAPNRGQFKLLDKLATMQLQIIQDTAYPNVVTWSEDGSEVIERGELGSGNVIALSIEQKVELLRHAAIPIQETGNVLSMVSQGVQKAGLPSIVHGNLPFEISGFMGSQLFMAIKYKLNSQLMAMQYMIGRTSTEILRQFKAGSFGNIKLTVENPRRKGKGEVYLEEFSKKDVPDVTYVDVSMPLGSMVDKMQMINMGRMALNEPALMSRPTLWEDFLEIEDPQLEYERLEADAVENLPGVKVIMAVERLEAKAKEAEANDQPEIAARFVGYAQQLAQTIAGPSGGGGGPGGPGGGPMPGAMPGEMSQPGGDMLRAAAGITPPGGQPGARAKAAQVRRQ